MATRSDHTIEALQSVCSSAKIVVRLALRFAATVAAKQQPPFTDESIPFEEQQLASPSSSSSRGISEISTTATRSEDLSSTGSSFGIIDWLETDPRSTDLQAFHTCKNFGQLPEGFTMVRKISQGINGDIFEYKWRSRKGSIDSDEVVERVAVKQLKNHHLDRDETVSDEREIHMGSLGQKVACAEDPLAEIGVLSYLAEQPDLPTSLLRLCGVFADAASPLTWLVTELAEGGELFNVAASENRVPEADTRRYAQQLFGAIGYLHEHHIGHRDVSLENILLKDGNVKLMDFGMAVRSHSPFDAVELRYFRAVGKQNYRAPECYCPPAEHVTVTTPADIIESNIRQVAMVTSRGGYLCEVKLPTDAKPGSACQAEVWGYAATPVDIFASGMCIFILLCQFPPWQSARLADPTYAFAHRNGDKGLEKLLQHWNKPMPSFEAMELLAKLLQADPSKRPSASTALSSPWLLDAQHAARNDDKTGKKLAVAAAAAAASTKHNAATTHNAVDAQLKCDV